VSGTGKARFSFFKEEEIMFQLSTIGSTLDEVEVPDKIMEKGRLPILPEAIKIIKENAPELEIGCWQLGPFTQAGHILELDLMLKGVFKQKKSCRSAGQVKRHDYRYR
jgi:hypothetical protein